MKKQIKKITSKITIAGLTGVGTLAVLLCSGCTAQTQPESQPVSASEIVAEVSEIPSEIESMETSEEPSEEISMVAPEEVELPELPILDENGEVYTPGMFTEEDVYAAIKRIEEDDSLFFEYGNNKDEAIGFMLWINSPYISKDTFMKVKQQYFANYDDMDICGFRGYDGYYKIQYNERLNVPINYVPINYLILDEKQAEAASQIVNYYNNNYYYYYKYYSDLINAPGVSKASTRELRKEFEDGIEKEFEEEFGEYVTNYALFLKENNMGYNPLIHILGSMGRIDFDNFDDGEYSSLCQGYKAVPYDELGNFDIQITFGDGQSYLFKKHRSPKHID